MAEKKIICDTDILIDYWNKNSLRHSNTKNILEDFGLNNIVLSAVSKMELIIGARDKGDLARINKNVDKFTIALMDNLITDLTITLSQEYKLSHGLALADAFIAATAISSGLELFTYKIRDYKFLNQLDLFLPDVS